MGEAVLTSVATTRGAVVARSNTWRWSVVALCTLASIIAYVDRVNLSVAIIDADFKQVFALSNTDRGLVNSAFFWSYAALQIPAGWLVDRYGSKLPLAISFVIWSVVSAATALASGFTELFTLRFLLGAGESPMHPASMRWIRYHFNESERGLAIGVFMSGSKYGPALGTLVAAWLIQSYGWRAMFMVLGAGSLLWLIPWMITVENDREQVTSNAAGASTDTPIIPFEQLMASPVLWGTIVGTFCYMYFVYFCLTWMPAYLNEARHLSLSSSSLYTTFSFAGMATVGIIGGFAADRLIARGYDAINVRKGFTIAGFLIASTELIGARSSSLEVALFFSVFSLSGLGLATANYWALTQTLIPRGAIGKIVGIQNCAASLPGIVAPILTGWLVQQTGGYEASMNAVWVFLLLGIGSYLFLVRRRYAPAPLNV
jgi:MFS transporter, ACS family, D-galactonate transporter